MTVPASNLERTVQDFAARLRSEFSADIEHDASGFKRQVIGFLSTALPPGPGRPRSEAVTRAIEMLAQGRSWQQIYGECLPQVLSGPGGADSRQLNQSRLRCAVRSRRNAIRRRRAKLTANSQACKT